MQFDSKEVLVAKRVDLIEPSLTGFVFFGENNSSNKFRELFYRQQNNEEIKPYLSKENFYDVKANNPISNLNSANRLRFSECF